jgi:E1-E2 ATPase
MATNIFVGPYVNGPEPDSPVSKAAGGGGWKNWFKALRKWLTRPASTHSANGDQPRPAGSKSEAPANRWAYRVTNYRRLRTAGLTCLVAPPNSAAGISSHLDLEAIAPAELREADVFLVESGQVVPADGTILEGIAAVDESAVVGQSPLTVRSAAGAMNVMRESHVVEGQIIVQVAPRCGHRLDWIDSSAQLGGHSPAKLAS